MTGSWELCISIKDKTLRAAVCRPGKKAKKIEVSKAFQINIPEEFSASRDAASAGAITGLIRTALKDAKISIKKYNLSISDRSIITRVIKLPKMEFNDLKSFMKLSIHQYFPIKIEEYCLDYKIQGINENDEKGYYNLLLVAIPKSIIDYYTQIFLKCGLKPKLINIYSDVVSNLFLKFADKDIAIVDINYNYTEFIMLEGKSIFINSIINYALPKTQMDINEETYLQVLDMDLLGEEFLTISESLKNYINFFSSRHHGKNIEEIYFIGEGAMMKEVINFLEESLGIKIRTGQNLLENKIITSSMPGHMKKQFYPERFFSCLGLISGGMSK